MKKNIFRQYDIRGIVGTELIIDQVYALTQAIAAYLLKKHPGETKIIVGRDGRLHSSSIHEPLVQALIDMGLDVIDVGLVPTPIVYFAVQYHKTPLAVVITASHNPSAYNGIKMWGVFGEQIQEIRALYESKMLAKPIGPRGTVHALPVIDMYIRYFKKQFAHLINNPIKAVVDCGSGSTGAVVPLLVKEMGWENIHLLCAEVDGTFPHHEADPTVPENMVMVAQALLNDQSYDVGLGFDGDGDRMNPMTKDGVLVPGDKVLAVFAYGILQHMPGAAVVCDIKSSGGLIDALKQWGALPCIAPSGTSNIKKSMKENRALLGGELSCHFFFNDRYFGYDDGIYAMFRLFELMVLTKKTLEELLAMVPIKISSPEFRIACHSDELKESIINDVKKYFATKPDSELITIDGIRAHMYYGWGLARASNTQPVICLRFESDCQDGLARVKNDFFTVLKNHFDEQALRESIEL